MKDIRSCLLTDSAGRFPAAGKVWERNTHYGRYEIQENHIKDDALIYQRSKDTVSKDEIRQLPFRQQIGYFKDYYLKIVLAVAAAAVFIGGLLNTSVFNRRECVLSVCCVNGSDFTESEALDQFLTEYIGIENKNDYVQTNPSIWTPIR